MIKSVGQIMKTSVTTKALSKKQKTQTDLLLLKPKPDNSIVKQINQKTSQKPNQKTTISIQAN